MARMLDGVRLKDWQDEVDITEIRADMSWLFLEKDYVFTGTRYRLYLAYFCRQDAMKNTYKLASIMLNNSRRVLHPEQEC